MLRQKGQHGHRSRGPGSVARLESKWSRVGAGESGRDVGAGLSNWT